VDVLRAIAAGADDRDRAAPAFPEEPLRLLEDVGALAATLPRGDGSRPSVDEEWSLLRRVASADGSVARILDGHPKGVDRICALAPAPLRRAEIAAIRLPHDQAGREDYERGRALVEGGAPLR
jgi:hypothetical protein